MPEACWPALRKLMLAALAGLGIAAGAAAESSTVADRWLINTGEYGERDRFTSYPAWTRLVESLSAKAKIGSMFLFSADSTQDMVATRNGTVAVIVGPAHMVSSALRHGHYLPVGVASRNVRIVLATLKTSAIRSFADARGKSLGLPGQDAIATYLMRGEANAAGSSIRQYFSKLYFTYYEGALLNALKFGTVDTVAVEETTFEQWLAKGEPVQEVMRTKESPGVAIVAHKSLGKNAIRAMRDAVADKSVPSQSGATFQTVDPAAYDYVSTLGYFTPRLLEGVQLVTAREARQLMARGVALYDTRVKTEFVVSRPAGAVSLPYVERSAKETDFDAGKDEFDMAKLPADKNKEMMFSCGGPECWKSYKAAVLAARAGYKRIYWFRGGIKEWAEAGLPIDRG
ncbi:MAG: PhnD/SsuA/transferrin family substrate-binding protein [Rhodocyclales bacterium]|nr:PhnD/SsuA/transferrin family substrate-binding protein [Rhodocyclales bacterium]MBI5784166.1 PhnD/SsuA/transferrin family substrate-binding protein [Rhodocyclales bacterium]